MLGSLCGSCHHCYSTGQHVSGKQEPPLHNGDLMLATSAGRHRSELNLVWHQTKTATPTRIEVTACSKLCFPLVSGWRIMHPCYVGMMLFVFLISPSHLNQESGRDDTLIQFGPQQCARKTYPLRCQDPHGVDGQNGAKRIQLYPLISLPLQQSPLSSL